MGDQEFNLRSPLEVARALCDENWANIAHPLHPREHMHRQQLHQQQQQPRQQPGINNNGDRSGRGNARNNRDSNVGAGLFTVMDTGGNLQFITNTEDKKKVGAPAKDYRKYSTKHAVLARMCNVTLHPLPRIMLLYRTLSTFQSKALKTLPRYAKWDKGTNRVSMCVSLCKRICIFVYILLYAHAGIHMLVHLWLLPCVRTCIRSRIHDVIT